MVLRPHGDASPLLLDGDLSDPGLLDDADDLPNAPGPAFGRPSAEQALLAARAVADRSQQRLCLRAEECQEQELFLARSETGCVAADRVEIGGRPVLLHALGDERDRSLNRRVDRARRRPESSVEECAQLVDDGLVAARRQDVDDRLEARI